LRLNSNKNDKKAHVPSFCTYQNHQPSWEGPNIPGFVTLDFCSWKKQLFIQKHKKTANNIRFAPQFEQKMTRMRISLHFAPIKITSRLGKVQIYPVQ
jgi:hypothetical protein